MHKKRKSYSQQCGGSEFFEHKKRKSRCQECKGGITRKYTRHSSGDYTVDKFENDDIIETVTTASDLAAAAARPAAATTASDLAAAAAGPAAASFSSPKRKNQKHRSDVYTVIKQEHNQD
jgi:hypothetical protein